MRVAIVAILVFHATPVFAWNALGHKVIAEIAWRELDSATRQCIVDTLHRYPRFDADFAGKMTDDVLRADKATQDRWIFQQAATWPDLARGLPPGERETYDRPTWHYVNFPLFLDDSDRMALEPRLSVNVSTEYPTDIAPEQFNVLQAIAHARATLEREAGLEAKAVAYCWLFHLVGDLHQPLHSTALFSVDSFPEGDRGGNEIPLARGRNLHSLWDNLLGRQHYMRNVDREVAELSDRERYGAVWDSAKQASDVRQWADESHALCKSVVYSDAILQAVRDTAPRGELAQIGLPESYMRRAGDVARRRIIEAGLRLASVLREE